MNNKDSKISKLIIQNYFEKLNGTLVVDVCIAGCGPSALALANELSKSGINIVIFESKNEPGGGIWGGGMMFNEIVIESDLEEYLKENGVNYKKYDDLITVDSVHFASSLLYNVTKNNVSIFNNVIVEDLVMYENKVSGVVINWAPTIKEKLHVDPLTIISKIVVDATGHNANLVKLLLKRLVSDKENKLINNFDKNMIHEYESFMDAEKGEKAVIENTKEIYPGLYVIGMAAVSVSGTPRMGPIFGGMILSGIKAAKLIEKDLIKLKNFNI